MRWLVKKKKKIACLLFLLSKFQILTLMLENAAVGKEHFDRGQITTGDRSVTEQHPGLTDGWYHIN